MSNNLPVPRQIPERRHYHIRFMKRSEALVFRRVGDGAPPKSRSNLGRLNVSANAISVVEFSNGQGGKKLTKGFQLPLIHAFACGGYPDFHLPFLQKNNGKQYH